MGEDQVSLRFLKADWPRLQLLRIEYPLENKSWLGACTKWQDLRALDLSGTELLDEEAVVLAKGDWPLLSALNLSNNEIQNTGANALAAGRAVQGEPSRTTLAII
jgi:hypothetical protein